MEVDRSRTVPTWYRTIVLPTHQYFGALCAQAGLVYSQKSYTVLVALAEADRPLTTYDVHRFAQDRCYPLALPTAYRVLKALATAGVALRYDLGGGVARYVLRRREEDQGHLINVADGTVVAISDKELTEKLSEIASGLGYRLTSYRLILYDTVSTSPVAAVPSKLVTVTR